MVELGVNIDHVATLRQARANLQGSAPTLVILSASEGPLVHRAPGYRVHEAFGLE